MKISLYLEAGITGITSRHDGGGGITGMMGEEQQAAWGATCRCTVLSSIGHQCVPCQLHVLMVHAVAITMLYAS